jgi:hypothetical protein
MRSPRIGAALLALFLALAPLAAGQPHRLEASCSRGWIKFWGAGKVHLEGKGSLLIKNASNLQVEVKGTWGQKTDLMDGSQYMHFEGTVDSIGPGAHFEIRGWNLGLSVHGRGRARFRGLGTYRLDDGPEIPWTDDPDKWTKADFRK